MADRGATISSIGIDTRTLPPDDQFEAWAAHSRNSRLTSLQDRGFDAHGRMWTLGPVQVTDIRLSPFVSDRDQALINATAAGHVQLVVLFDGAVRLEADGLDARMTAPDLFVRDFARPSRATSTRIHCSVVYFARDFLEEAAGGAVAQGRLPDRPETAILGAAVATMIRHLSDADAASAGYYARTLRDLFAAALRQEDAPASAAGLGRLQRARDYIDRQPPGTLSPERMAGALGLSRSRLYELFRPFGGISAYDRLNRLRGVYRSLGDTADDRSIAEIGAAHGFDDPAGLTRSFRKTFGRSPQDVRGERAGETAPPGRTPAEQARMLIETLG